MIRETAAAPRPYIYLIDWNNHDNKMTITKVAQIKLMLRVYVTVIYLFFFFVSILERALEY